MRSKNSQARRNLGSKNVPGKTENVSEDKKLSRRAYIASVATVALSVPPAIESAARLGAGLGRLVKGLISLPPAASMQVDDERLLRLRRLLFPDDQMLDMVPARDHPLGPPPDGHTTYSNEEVAESAILRMFPGPAKEIVYDPYSIEAGHSTVLLGSPISNRATMAVLGPTDNPCFCCSGLNFEAQLQYSIRTIPNQIVTRLQDGRAWPVQNNAIIDRNGNYVAIPEYDGHKKLRTDFLLVTRIPRELGGSNELILSPTHGPGMRAVEKVLFELNQRDLDVLEKSLRGGSYFQAIFEMRDLYELRGTTHVGSVRLLTCDAGAPRPLNVTST